MSQQIHSIDQHGLIIVIVSLGIIASDEQSFAA